PSLPPSLPSPLPLSPACRWFRLDKSHGGGEGRRFAASVCGVEFGVPGSWRCLLLVKGVNARLAVGFPGAEDRRGGLGRVDGVRHVLRLEANRAVLPIHLTIRSLLILQMISRVDLEGGLGGRDGQRAARRRVAEDAGERRLLLAVTQHERVV